MQADLAQQGLEAFLASSGSRQPPIIPSAWYVANICPPPEREAAQAARDLGYAVLTGINNWAPLMRTAQKDELLRKARALVDLADWVGGPAGYGNLFLSQRAQDVAGVGLARLVIDLSFPLAEPAALVRRCEVGPDAPSRWARVLNYEATAPLFPTDAGLTREALERAWYDRREHERIAGKVSPDSELMRDPSVQAWRQRVMQLGLDPDKAGEHIRVFEDDDLPPLRISTNLWNLKQHEQVARGGWGQSAGTLESVVLFREVIGDFPLVPRTPPWGGFSPGEEAFHEAWRPYRHAYPENIDLGAWARYEQIRSGRFVDGDTGALRGLGLEAGSQTPGAGTASGPATPANGGAKP